MLEVNSSVVISFDCNHPDIKLQPFQTIIEIWAFLAWNEHDGVTDSQERGTEARLRVSASN
jgi:hypothetical protein